MNKPLFRRVCAAFSFIFGVGVICCSYRSTSLPATASKMSDEYAVYSALIQKSFLEDGVNLLVIRNRTLFYANPDYLKSTTPEQRVQELKRYYPLVDESALQDFDAKHVKSTELTSNFELPVMYVLLNDGEFAEQSSSQNVLQAFRDFNQRFPGARGIIALSQVGFNKTHDQAFVRVEFTFCPLCGHGDKVFLKKESGRWTVVDTYFGWAS